MWQRAKRGNPTDTVRAISLTCDSVDKATIFLRSLQYRALTLLRTSEYLASTPIITRLMGDRTCPTRISTKTPAATRVDECTKEDTGVGAAIASGSHAVQGNSALFVKAPMVKSQPACVISEGG